MKLYIIHDANHCQQMEQRYGKSFCDFYLHILIVKLEKTLKIWSTEIPDLSVFAAMISLSIICPDSAKLVNAKAVEVV